MSRSLRSALIFIPFFLLLAVSARAESIDITTDERVILFERAGHHVAVPFPGFVPLEVQGDVVLEHVKISTTTFAEGVELVEFISVNESFDDWTGLTAAMIVNDPDYPLNAMIGSLVAPFRAACEEDNLVFTTIPPQAAFRNQTYVVLCGAYKPSDSPQVTEGQGEILLATVHETGQGIAKVYSEFRGPAFDVNDQATWPLHQVQFMLHAVELQARSGLWAIEDE